MVKIRPISRRKALVLGAGAAALPLVHMRTASAAGTLKLAFWDHWVPAANPVMRKLVTEWGEKNHVAIELDLLSTGQANSKLPVAEAAEALAGTGHDVMTFPAWGIHQYRQKLEPIDDVVDGLIKQYGAIDPMDIYLAKVDGHWLGLPSSVGSQLKGACARISLFQKWGHDVRKWYPDHPGDAKTAAPWTYDLMLELAGEAKTANMAFALGLGNSYDCVDWTGALLRAYGAELVDAEGRIQLRSEPVQQVLEYMQKLAPFLPKDAAIYNNASNNKALIANQTALIFNPPSAWWVARRDAIKVAEDCWQFPSPSGPKGRFIPHLPYFWGVWSFSQNKSAAKELLAWLQQRKRVETLCDASVGYDIPQFESMHDFKIWATVKPPLGVEYNYPTRPWHDAETNVAGYPAPPHVATQLYFDGTFNAMVVKLAARKEKMKDVLDWGENRINGFINM